MFDYESLKQHIGTHVEMIGARLVETMLNTPDKHVSAAVVNYYVTEADCDERKEGIAEVFLNGETRIEMTDNKTIAQVSKEADRITAEINRRKTSKTAPKLQTELDQLTKYLKDTTQAKHRIRFFETYKSKSYHSLINAYNRYLIKLEKDLPDAAAHLRKQLTTGEYFYYSSVDMTETLSKVIKAEKPDG